MDIFLLYLFTRLDAFKMTLVVLAVFLCIAALITIMTTIDTYSDEEKTAAAERRKIGYKLIACAFAIQLLNVAVPNRESAAVILGGYAIIEVARSETAGRLASKSVQLIEQTLDGYLKKSEEKK